jgi:hypothetical protein
MRSAEEFDGWDWEGRWRKVVGGRGGDDRDGWGGCSIANLEVYRVGMDVGTDCISLQQLIKSDHNP